MLYTEYPRKWAREPDLGEFCRCASGVGRVCKCKIVGQRLELGDKPQRVGAPHMSFFARRENVDVSSQRTQRFRTALDELCVRRAARKRFESEGAGSCEEIEYPAARDVVLKNAHPGFADSVECRPYVAPWWSFDCPAPPLARDDAHLVLSRNDRIDVGDARLEPAHAAILVALELERNVYRSGLVEFGNPVREAPANRFDLTGSGGQLES